MNKFKKVRSLIYIVCLCGLIALFAWLDSVKLHIFSKDTLLLVANITAIVLIPSGLLLTYLLTKKQN